LRSIVCDKVVGLHLALAIAAALVHRLRTGEGQSIEVPMLETMTSFMMAEHLAGHTMVPAQGEIGYQRLMSPNRRPFKTADGYMAIMPYNTKQWVRFLTLVEEDQLAASDWIRDGAARSHRIDELYELIARVAPSRTNDQWLDALKSYDVPCAVVNSLQEIFADDQLAASGILQTMDDAELGSLRYLQPGFFSDAAQPVAPRRAPHLGEHGREILAELGVAEADIQRLIADRVVGDSAE